MRDLFHTAFIVLALLGATAVLWRRRPGALDAPLLGALACLALFAVGFAYVSLWGGGLAAMFALSLLALVAAAFILWGKSRLG